MLWRERTSCRVLSTLVSEIPLRSRSLRVLQKDGAWGLTRVIGVPGLFQDSSVALLNILAFISGALSKANLVRTHCDPKIRFLLGQMKTGNPLLLLGWSTGLQGPRVGNGDQY